jgi:hypothetical protein
MGKQLFAFCGLDCAACPAFNASKRLSMEERQKVADQWKKEFNTDLKATDIDCVGCPVKEGVHVGYCSMCQIRSCAEGRGLTTCAKCPDFGCEKLEGFLKSAPQARENLAALRAR